MGHFTPDQIRNMDNDQRAWARALAADADPWEDCPHADLLVELAARAGASPDSLCRVAIAAARHAGAHQAADAAEAFLGSAEAYRGVERPHPLGPLENECITVTGVLEGCRRNWRRREAGLACIRTALWLDPRRHTVRAVECAQLPAGVVRSTLARP